MTALFGPSGPPRQPTRFPRATRRHPLRLALEMDNAEEVGRLLEADENLAREPLRDRRVCEPLVLAAVRSGCSARVLGVLLQRGAPADDPGHAGLTALEAVAVGVAQRRSSPDAFGGIFAGATDKSWAQNPGAASEERCCALAGCLLAFGADPMRMDEQTGLTVAERAERAGQPRLAELLGNWSGIQECRALRKIWAHVPSTAWLKSEHLGILHIPHGVCENICGFLAPSAFNGSSPSPWVLH